MVKDGLIHEGGAVCNGFQVWEALQPIFDSERFVPYVYDERADCFIPIEQDVEQMVTAERSTAKATAKDGDKTQDLWHVDIKLVPQINSQRPVGNLAEQLVCDSSESSLTGSWYGIGIVRGKTVSNHGSLWRSALQFGASMTFTIGRRYEKKIEGSADIYKTYRQIPCLAYTDVGNFMASAPVDAQIIAVEYGGMDLTEFKHPKRALYILGSEDCGIPPALVQHAHHHISIATAEGRPSSLNVAAAGAVIMYDRQMKEMQARRERKV